MIVEHEDRDRASSPFRAGSIRRRGQLQPLVLLVCIVLILVVPATVSSADENHSQVDSQSQDEVKLPQTDLSRVPQFASGQADAGHEGHEHDSPATGVSLFSLAKPTGILTLSLVGLTVCLGLLRRVRRLKPRLMLKLHKIMGFCALISGLIHATIVLLTH